jgi:hypothetical protein
MAWRNVLTLAAVLVCGGLLATDAVAQKRDRDDRKGGGNWVELGCQQVSFIGKDRDTIKVGRREGRFKAIRLKARGNDVELLDLKVVYVGGEPDDIQVRSRIRANSQTRALDLKGRERAIDRIEMVYKSRPNFKGLATVCVDGLD